MSPKKTPHGTPDASVATIKPAPVSIEGNAAQIGKKKAATSAAVADDEVEDEEPEEHDLDEQWNEAEDVHHTSNEDRY